MSSIASGLATGAAKHLAQLGFKIAKQLLDNDVFAFVMVIEITGANAHHGGNIDRGNIDLALIIKQSEASAKDFLLGV